MIRLVLLHLHFLQYDLVHLFVVFLFQHCEIYLNCYQFIFLFNTAYCSCFIIILQSVSLSDVFFVLLKSMNIECIVRCIRHYLN